MTRSVAENLTCKDSRLLEAYLDGELDAGDLVEVETHLSGTGGADGVTRGGCDVCRERLALQRATRQSLKRVVRTASMEMASGGRDALRARALTAILAEQDRQASTNARQLAVASGRFHWRTLVPIASAAALALFWGAASRGPLYSMRQAEPRWPDAPGTGGMRAGMGDDLLADLLHEHSNPMPPQWTDPSDVRALDQYIGVPVRPAWFERNGASLVGARVLPLHQERAAMLQYVIGHGASQRRLSVFVYDPRKIQISGPGLSPRAIGTSEVRVGQESGYSVAVMQKGGVGYAVASDLGTDQSAEVAALAGAAE
jgi:anti-sigma factor RsiW